MAAKGRRESIFSEACAQKLKAEQDFHLPEEAPANSKAKA